MEANSTHISLETAKLLKDCRVESEYKFFFDNYDKEELKCSISNNEHFLQNIVRTYSAYTWQEILWEYPKEFFGDKLINNEYWKDKYDVFDSVDYYSDGHNELLYTEIAYKRHSRIILDLLQQEKYNEADEYFRENCILIKK